MKRASRSLEKLIGEVAKIKSRHSVLINDDHDEVHELRQRVSELMEENEGLLSVVTWLASSRIGAKSMHDATIQKVEQLKKQTSFQDQVIGELNQTVKDLNDKIRILKVQKKGVHARRS